MLFSLLFKHVLFQIYYAMNVFDFKCVHILRSHLMFSNLVKSNLAARPHV